MKTKTIFIIIFSSALFTFISCSDKWSESADEVSITKVTKYAKEADGKTPQRSKIGTVVFSHKTHDKEGVTCIKCHHKFENDERNKKCAVCHIGEDGKGIMHDLCIGCHRERKVNVQDCMQCH